MSGNRTLKLSILADIDNLKKNLGQADNEISSFGSKLKDFGKKAAVAFGVAAAAAAAYAGKLIVDGVKAAIEDSAAQERLANSLRNVTGATDKQIASVEKQINTMSLAFGVADDKLRPAFQRLATATGDLEQANKGLQLALDISAATGKDLEAVSNALGKAYEGNVGALGRLGVGLSSAEMKALGLDGTMAKLAETFGGAAATQAGTLEGKIAVLKNRFEEAKETVGMALLPILDTLLSTFNERLAPAIDRIANSFGGENGVIANVKAFVSDVTKFLNPILEAIKEAFDKVSTAIADNKGNFQDVLKFFKNLYDFFSTYILPILKTQLVNAIEGIGTAFSVMIRVVTPIIGAISNLLNGLLSLINRVASALSNLTSAGSLISNLTKLPSKIFSKSSFDTGSTINSGTGSTATTSGGVTINVTSPSIIDETGFTRAVIDAFNSVESRTGGGASTLIYV